MTEQDELLLKIKHSIVKEDASAEITLFGSRARGDNTPESDWDILVLIDSIKTMEAEERFRNNLYDIELESGQIISPIVYSKEYWISKLKYSPLFKSVNKEGIRL
ncbi:MAG: nucleotidyltransferase domain-containing protein [Bacteroidales bacterium]|nr:nucleotidyltransferase domain-containing protein [Bacteroidales bacterium]